MALIEPVISFFYQMIGVSDSFFASLLRMLELKPVHYPHLFPPALSIEYVGQLAEEGVIPTIPDLAPAFTYAIILSIIRYLLQNYLIRVSTIILMRFLFY